VSVPATEIAAALERVVCARIPGATGIRELRRLSGGASQETWSFDAVAAGAPVPLILRRRPPGVGGSGSGMGIALETEAEILGLAAANGVPVARVHAVLAEGDALGSGYLMERLAGETIARRVLRDDAFAQVRPRLARQCGGILARIHAIPSDALPKLAFAPARVQLDQYRALYDAYDQPHPVFELALRWLAERAQDPPRVTFVHGDFRNGNLIFDPQGVRGVLDWELAHTGDPMEDLGWMCVPSWRFGEIDHPVGGFGSREELFAGYEEAGGGAVDPERVRTWEVLGTLKWGIMCMTMYSIFAGGGDRSVERAAIGRRSSETEVDLLALLDA
jgi:aminoglycoside phosphotransferase (APT) family kinase protein